ncbi:myosin-11-like isoform x2 [Plakobranchus ocellatus]|uniref:Myosin-11-like isoform x2 n=1 Tax=Plakobranchus ocellatus TaxID=259542 RepID=A0AAV4BJJ5_9GAST|nr:myosin-11-like isoform x2 [Plakobranchus ocellatus]
MSSQAPTLTDIIQRHVHQADSIHEHDSQKIAGHAQPITRTSVDKGALVDSGEGSEEQGETYCLADQEHKSLTENCFDCPSSSSRKRHDLERRDRKARNIKGKSLASPTKNQTQTPGGEVGWGTKVDGRKSGSDSAVSVTSTDTNRASSGDQASTEWPAFSSPSMSEGSKASASSSPHRNAGSPTRSRSPELSRTVRLRQERRRREQDLKETRASLKKHHIGENNARVGSGRSRLEAEPSGKFLERMLAASTRSSFHSLGTIRSMEQRYGRKSQRSRGDKPKVTRSYESKSTSPTPMPEQESENRTKFGISRSIQNHTSSRSSRRSKSLEKSSGSKKSISASGENSLPGGEKSPARATLNFSVSFPSPPPSTSSPRGPMESPDFAADSHTKSDAAEPRERGGSTPDQRSQQSSSHIEPVSSSSSGNSRIPLSQGGGPDNKAVATAEEVERKTNTATNAILRDGLPDIPPLESATETCLLDWRAVFRVEMMRLRKEVNDFRQFCQSQIKLHASLVEKSLCTGVASETATPLNGVRAPDASRLGEQLKDLEQNMQLYQKKQQVLDLETELLAKEEQLSERQCHLEEYEKEILEVESMLNQRQAICDRRQRALFTLDEELQTLRQELEETREHIHSDGSIPESSSERARRNWDMVRRNLMDKQQLLETTVQKYRSELAAATSTIAGKDILITRLQSVAMENEEELNRREKRIQQLEAKLALTLSEARQLTERVHSSNGSNHINLNNSNGGTGFREALASSNPSRRGSGAAGGSSSLSFTDGGNNTGEEFASPFSTRFQGNHQTSADGPAEGTSGGNPYRLSFRGGNAMYRRPSNNAGSEQASEFGSIKPMADHGGGGVFQSGGPRMSRKRNSVSDNAISRLTLSTPRTDDKFGRGSSACVVQ